MKCQNKDCLLLDTKYDSNCGVMGMYAQEYCKKFIPEIQWLKTGWVKFKNPMKCVDEEKHAIVGIRTINDNIEVFIDRWVGLDELNRLYEPCKPPFLGLI